MKLYIIMLVVGVILLLATNSEFCLNNITGPPCHKLNILSDVEAKDVLKYTVSSRNSQSELFFLNVPFKVRSM